MPNLVWFRTDLRISDNTALSEAAKDGDAVVGVYLLTPDQWREHDWGGPKVDFTLRSVAALKEKLEEKNIPLLVKRNDTFRDAEETLLAVAREVQAEALYFNYEYEWNERTRDRRVRDSFQKEGLSAVGFHDQTALPPNDDSLVTQGGKPYSVFTPFRRRWIELAQKRDVPKIAYAPRQQEKLSVQSMTVPKSLSGFECSERIQKLWPAGEDEAARRLKNFVESCISDYKELRDIPSKDGTSTLSPYLAAGAVSPRQCLKAAMTANRNSLSIQKTGGSAWINEIIWREFYRHVMIHHPRVCKYKAFKGETDEAVEWRYDKDQFERWKNGETGFPIIDAAMRSLREDGWMHNRLRMVVSMFLTKDLLIDWRWGEKHFARSLVDLDLGSNNGGWQWSASVGTDAAPYFRIFNPWSQSSRFDPEGKFIKEYCPELEQLEAKQLHDPKKLTKALESGLDYPKPMIDHKEGRERALKAFQ